MIPMMLPERETAPQFGIPVDLFVNVLNTVGGRIGKVPVQNLKDAVVLAENATLSGVSPDRIYELKHRRSKWSFALLERGESCVVERAAVGPGSTMFVGLSRFGRPRYGLEAKALDLGDPEAAHLPVAVSSWLHKGERGSSSEAMCRRLYGFVGMQPENPTAHPHDADDFRRCYLFVEAVPGARERLAELRSLSPIWSKIVDAWPALSDAMGSEPPDLPSIKRILHECQMGGPDESPGPEPGE